LCGGSSQVDGQAGIVELAVVVQYAATQSFAVERGGQGPGFLLYRAGARGQGPGFPPSSRIFEPDAVKRAFPPFNWAR